MKYTDLSQFKTLAALHFQLL